MSQIFYKFRVLTIGIILGLYAILGLHASSLDAYPQAYSYWKSGELSLATSQLEAIAID